MFFKRKCVILRIDFSDMRHYALFLLVFLTSVSVLKAQKRSVWEYEMDIPVYVDSIHKSLTYPLAWRNCRGSLGFDTWKSIARQRVTECMGPQPPRAEKWDMEIVAEEQRNGYKAQKVAFQLSRWYRVTAYILIPDGKGRFPAINLLHDHGAHLYIGKEKMIAPVAETDDVVADADAWVRQLYEGQYLGDYLASHGFVVFSIDAPLWGERGRKEGVDRKKYDIIAGNMMMLGQNLCAYMHYDDIVSTDFLASLPYVDAGRIGAAGLSMGAYRAWMLSALSDKVKAACAVCWMSTTSAQLTAKYGRKENGGFANCIPGLRRYLDYPDIASLAAPKPTLLISGSMDKLFPVDGVEGAFGIMRQAWEDAGAAENLKTSIEPQPHECNKDNQKAILDFMIKYLK